MKSLKVIEYSLFIFIFHICSNFQSKKKKEKRLVMTCIFECFQSHCQVLKKYKNFCTIIIFGEGSFMFSFVGYGLVKKSFGARCTFENVVGKTKLSKDECESFYNQN